MKKSFKLALQGMSIAAMLIFASRGFAAAPDVTAAPDAVASGVAAPEAMLAGVAAPETAAVGKVKKIKKHKKNATGEEVTAHKGKKDKGAKDGKHHDKNHDEAADVANAEWIKSANSLTTLATKITTEAPKTVAEIAAITNDTDRRVAMFRYQEYTMQNKTMNNIEVSKEEQEAFEALLLKEAEAVNAAFNQTKELVHAIKGDNNLLDDEEVHTAYATLFHGMEEHHEHDKASHRPMRKLDEAGDKDEKHEKKTKNGGHVAKAGAAKHVKKAKKIKGKKAAVSAQVELAEVDDK